MLRACRNAGRARCRWLRDRHPYVVSLSKIDRQLAVAYSVDLAEGRAPRTFNAHRNALVRVTEKLRLASGLEGTNPWKFVETKPLDTQSKREFTEPQVQAVFDKLADAKYAIPCRAEWQVIYHAGAFSGMRLADCVLLTWDCLDLPRDELSVIPLKTARKGKRAHVPIHPAFAEQIRRAAAWRRNAYICPALA
ncbi:MAG: integrase, partial [Rhodothermales bacterium]